LPSTHEGLPIALLEAMSHNLPIVITNLPSLVELKLPESTYIDVGDVAALQGKMASFLTDGCEANWSEWLKPYAVSSVADRTIDVYKSALSK
jgi:glycosyltransferase involved in cell wall biosynthesis